MQHSKDCILRAWIYFDFSLMKQWTIIYSDYQTCLHTFNDKTKYCSKKGLFMKRIASIEMVENANIQF